jgi:hypothetical protein
MSLVTVSGSYQAGMVNIVCLSSAGCAVIGFGNPPNFRTVSCHTSRILQVLARSLTVDRYSLSTEPCGEIVVSSQSVHHRIRYYVGDASGGWLTRVVRPIVNSNLWIHKKPVESRILGLLSYMTCSGLEPLTPTLSRWCSPS